MFETISENENEQYPVWKQVLLLPFFVFIFLNIFPFPFDQIPGLTLITEPYVLFMNKVNLWFGIHVLQLKNLAIPEFSGSGDTMFEYVRILTYLSISFLISLCLFLILRHKLNMKKINSIGMVYIRYYVGIMLISYGLAKLQTYGQFGTIEVGRLDKRVGDCSPMGLLWTFMGYSKSYCVFTGIAETLGGLLLLFRRTLVLGSLIGITVMSNVVMLNFCYDVPVKIFSSFLLLLLIYIVSPFIHNLIQFLFFNKTVSLSNNSLKLPKRWMRVSRILIKSFIIGGIFLMTAFQEFEDNEPINEDHKSIEGRYKITSFKTNDTNSNCLEDSIKWSKFNLINDYARVYTKNDSSELFSLKTDTAKKQILLISETDSTQTYKLDYDRISDSSLAVKGMYKKDTINVIMKKKDRMEYSLINRGFHWINETPPNW